MRHEEGVAKAWNKMLKKSQIEEMILNILDMPSCRSVSEELVSPIFRVQEFLDPEDVRQKVPLKPL